VEGKQDDVEVVEIEEVQGKQNKGDGVDSE